MVVCPTHPGAESVGTCARCGRFYCAPELVELAGQRYCGDCGVREDVDWLGHHYRRLEGTRSGLVWVLFLMGLVVGVGDLAAVLTTDEWKERIVGAGVLVFAVACVAMITGKVQTRIALVAASLIAALLFAVGSRNPLAALAAVPLLGLAGAAWTDVRTRLFQRVPVPRETLRKHYKREGSNPLAITASRLAFLSLLIPGLGLLSLVLGVMALTRIDSKAVPPVGNLSAALAAILFSVFTTAFWALNVLSYGH